MRQVAARADPDQPPRVVTLPATWDDRAAEALAALVPGENAISLAGVSSVWISLVASRARLAPDILPGTGRGRAAVDDDIALSLQTLLKQRRAAPNAAIWRSDLGAPGFRLNAAAFHEPGGSFDVEGFGQAAAISAKACRLLAPSAARYEIGLTGLDDLLACLAMPYDSRAARATGACLAALMRASVEQALEGDQRDLLATGADWPAPPRHCPVPGLAEAAARARAGVSRVPGAIPASGVYPPGPADALLGVETAGIAPAFSPVRELHLTRAAQDRLAASAMSPEAALAAVLMGDDPLPVAGVAAHEAMRQAIAPYLDAMPGPPAALPVPAAQAADASGRTLARPEPLPARHAGLTQKVTIGGHRLFLRTAEYPDGRLGEITLNLPRETAAVRCLAECFAQAVSLGLQHGVGLQEFVEAFTLTRFGPAGLVEGDPDVDRATSVLDYVFRTLSANYLNASLPPPDIADDREAASGVDIAATPLLPLDLPQNPARRRQLRLVA